jgi:hypothetical protein
MQVVQKDAPPLLQFTDQDQVNQNVEQKKSFLQNELAKQIEEQRLKKEKEKA